MKNRILLTVLVTLAAQVASAEYAYLCEMKPKNFLGIGGSDRVCKTITVEGPFDKECRTPSEVTFKSNGPLLDYARNENSDFPVGNSPSVPYTVEIGIAGMKNSVDEAQFLTFRRTDPKGKTRLSGCALYSNNGKQYVDRHNLRLIAKNANSAKYEVRQHDEVRAYMVIEDRGSVQNLYFVDEKGNLAGANLLGLQTKAVYSTYP